MFPYRIPNARQTSLYVLQLPVQIAQRIRRTVLSLWALPAGRRTAPVCRAGRGSSTPGPAGWPGRGRSWGPRGGPPPPPGALHWCEGWTRRSVASTVARSSSSGAREVGRDVIVAACWGVWPKQAGGSCVGGMEGGREGGREGEWEGGFLRGRKKDEKRRRKNERDGQKRNKEGRAAGVGTGEEQEHKRNSNKNRSSNS